MIITVYYSKLTGEIYTVIKAENKYNFERFGKFEQEMSQILDIIYVQYNDNLFYNYNSYRVVNGEVVLKEEANTINIIE